MGVMETLGAIQTMLNVPKSQRNDFGKYNYRNIEDLTEAIKPLLKEHNATLIMSDDVVAVGERIYIKATVTLYVGDASVSATGWAREALNKKGMDESQITGSCSSYARKYGFCGLFCVDGEKDADSRDNRQKASTNNHAPKNPKEPLDKMLDGIEFFANKDLDSYLNWFQDKVAPQIAFFSEPHQNRIKNSHKEMQEILMKKVGK